MKKNKFRLFLIIFLIGCVIGTAVVAYMLYMPHRNIQHEKSITIAATELVDWYSKNEASANQQFLDKAIEVTGVVDNLEVNNNGQSIVVLAGTNPLSGVRCTFSKNPSADKGASVTIKGRCTGFLSDVILIDCSIVKN